MHDAGLSGLVHRTLTVVLRFSDQILVSDHALFVYRLQKMMPCVPRDRLLLISALAIAVLSLLGAAGEASVMTAG